MVSLATGYRIAAAKEGTSHVTLHKICILSVELALTEISAFVFGTDTTCSTAVVQVLVISMSKHNSFMEEA